MYLIELAASELGTTNTMSRERITNEKAVKKATGAGFTLMEICLFWCVQEFVDRHRPPPSRTPPLRMSTKMRRYVKSFFDVIWKSSPAVQIRTCW